MSPPLIVAFAKIDWAVVAAYLLGVLLIGAWFSRKRSAADDDYFLAGRSMPAWTVTLSLLATSLSAATFIGAPDQAFHGDLTFLILYLGNVAGVLLVAWLFVPKLYAAGTTTIYGFLGQRLGQGAQRAASLTFLLGRMLASGSRLFLASIPLWMLLTAHDKPLSQARPELVGCVLLVGVVGTAYTLMGGIRAVMWTDVVQLALVFGAVAATTVVAYRDIGQSPGEIIAGLREAGKFHAVDWSLDPTKRYTVWTALLGNTIFFAAVFGTDHDLAQRFLTARSIKSGAWSVIASQAVGFVAVALFMGMGLLLFVFYHGDDAGSATGPLAGQPVYVVFMVTKLPPVVAGLAVAGLFASAQSSMDSATNAMAGSFIHDLWRPPNSDHKASPSRRVTLGVGATLTLFAVGCALTYDPAAQSFLDFALSVMSYAVTGLLGVFACAMFTRRGNGPSAVAALLTAAAITLVAQPFAQQALFGGVYVYWLWAVPVAAAASFGVCCAGRSQQANPPPRGFEAVALSANAP